MHCIQVLNSDLTFSGNFGKHGSGKGKFNSPLALPCDRTGKVYVADRFNHCIQVFMHSRGTICAEGLGVGQVTEPFGVSH